MRRDHSALPAGQVTLLFTDIQGSTRLLEDLGARFGDLLAVHNETLRRAWSAHRGVEVSTEGDAFFVAFAGAQDAVDAAATAQRALRVSRWPGDVDLRVRMGIHSGAPQLHEGGRDYWGRDVNLAARVAAAAHGGQVLVTGATAAQVSDPLDDLGEWRLKDFDTPERLFQLVVGGEGADRFPPPRAMDLRVTNLPHPTTTLIGRQKELQALRRHLTGSVRIVTIVGRGGMGKTRLAIEVGHDLMEHFADGVLFAELSAVTEPAEIAEVIARAALVRDLPDVDTVDAVRERLCDRSCLLIVDNCEHLLSGIGVLGNLLAAAPDLRILATSQAPLRLYGEHSVMLDSLDLPDDDGDVEAIAAASSVALFVDRARQIDPDFELTDANATAVADICRRLDGMPMAIELSAARTRLLAPERLAHKLSEGFDIVATTSRERPARQTSLAAALEWTLGLLSDAELAVFTRWGIFAGRPTLEQAELICASDSTALTAIEVLVDLSLLRRDRDGRLRMPQSVKAHAELLLATSGTRDALAGRHAATMADSIETCWRAFFVDTMATVDVFVADRDDVFAALRWARDNAPAIHAALAGNMIPPLVWAGSELTIERDIKLALAHETAPTRLHARLLLSAATTASARGDRKLERTQLEAAIAIAEQLGGDRELALTYAVACKLVVTGDQPGMSPRALIDAARRRAQVAGDRELLSLVDGFDAEVLVWEGQYEAGLAALERVLADPDARNLAAVQSRSLLAETALQAGEFARAFELLLDRLRFEHASGSTPSAVWAMEEAAACLVELGRADEALTLLGVGEAHEAASGMGGRPAELTERIALARSRARSALGDAAADAALQRGRSMRYNVGVHYALRLVDR